MKLTTRGEIWYITPDGWNPSKKLPQDKPKKDYRDNFGNIWTKGSSRTKGEAIEWDVILSTRGKEQLGRWLSQGNTYLNISLKGIVTHCAVDLRSTLRAVVMCLGRSGSVGLFQRGETTQTDSLTTWPTYYHPREQYPGNSLLKDIMSKVAV